jgi:hypothetical protein
MQGLLPGDLANVRRPAAENGSYAHADAPAFLAVPWPRGTKAHRTKPSVEHEADE